MSATIELWHFPLDGGADAALPFLDAAERNRLRRFDRADLAAAFALRRAARRVLLAERTGAKPSDIALVEEGRPRLTTGAVEFSASHSGSIGVLAIAPCPMGVDVETDRRIDAPALARRLLSPAERIEHMALDDAAQRAALLRTWCGKEAVLKAMSIGLDLGALGLITLPSQPHPGWSPVGLTGKLAAPGEWHVCWPDLAPGCTVAIASTDPLPVEVLDARPVLARHGLAVRPPAPSDGRCA